MRSRSPLLLALPLITLACSGGAKDAQGPPDAGPTLVGPESVVTVREEAIERGPRIAGSLEARSQGTVRAESGGSVERVAAEVGQPVKKGQLLARIEDAGAGEALTSARTAVTAARTDLSVASRQVERTRALVQAGALAEQDLENARSAQAAARARLSQAQAALAAAKKQVDATVVTSPLAGVVSDKQVSAGDVVAPGAPLFTVIDPGSMRLEASVPAEQLSTLEVGKAVSFTVRGYPEETFTGTISRIAPAADPQTRQIPIIVDLPNEGGELVAGLFAEGRVAAETHEGLVVPERAVGTEGDDTFVLRVRDGMTERVPVKLGVRDEQLEQVEIRGELHPGDQLLSGPALDIPPGTPVEITGTAKR